MSIIVLHALDMTNQKLADIKYALKYLFVIVVYPYMLPLHLNVAYDACVI